MNSISDYQYDAHGFHDRFKNGRTSGTLSRGYTHLTFSWDGGSVEIPLSRLKLVPGGANDRLIFLTHPSLPDWTLYTSDHALLQDPGLLEIPELAAQITVLKRKKAGQWIALGLVAMVVLALIWGLFAAKPRLVNTLAAQVPVSWERKLGDTVFTQYRIEASFLEDEALQDQLDRLTAALTELIPDKRYDFSFHIVEDSTLNAFALPGGHVVIHSGAIRTADTPEELLGVLAHEIAHVTRRHGIKNMINSVGVVLLVQTFFGDSTALLAILSEAAPYLLEQKHSRDSERDADETGLRYLEEAGINPLGMMTFFEKIQKGHGGAVEEGLNFLSTHPTTRERIERIQNRISSMDTRNFRNFGPVLDDLKRDLDASLSSRTTKEGEHEDNH